VNHSSSLAKTIKSAGNHPSFMAKKHQIPSRIRSFFSNVSNPGGSQGQCLGLPHPVAAGLGRLRQAHHEGSDDGENATFLWRPFSGGKYMKIWEIKN
jgi:hypothetical protein